jgi:cytochrome c peroxidase
MRTILMSALLLVFGWATLFGATYAAAQEPRAQRLDRELQALLEEVGFTGTIEASLEQRLGRAINRKLANVGRLLWFDTITGLNDDNTCAGCHAPTSGFGDTQSIAIGIENNGVVGPNRAGPRNMRRSPIVINTAFYPALMWNGRFFARSGDPFDNRAGFVFPAPEGETLSYLPHLLTAQAFIPPTERTEVTGFAFEGDNHAIRAEVLARLNDTPAYRKLFARVFPDVRAGGPITFDMFAQAIAEFEFSLTFANAPIDRYARGEQRALTADLKRGAILFFGEAGCVQCHSVAGASNEMFSDFQNHVIGVPQLVPRVTNNAFDGPAANEDFGLEQFSGDPADRYKFRTAPLRNIAVQPSYMHNGAYSSLEDAIRHHLDVVTAVKRYSAVEQRLDPDLIGPLGPMEPVLDRLDPLLQEPIVLSEEEFRQLVGFVRVGLLDPRASPERLRRLVPNKLPSGRTPLIFEFPKQP